MVHFDNYRRDKAGLYVLKLSRFSHLLIRFPGIKRVVERIVNEFPDNFFNRFIWRFTESFLEIRVHANASWSFFLKYAIFHRSKQVR